MWKQPHVGSMDLRRYLQTTGDGVKVRQMLHKRPAWHNYVEPRIHPGLECTAAMKGRYDSFRWETIPCNFAFYQSSYICEIRTPFHRRYMLQQLITTAVYVECPPKTINLEYGICISIYTLPLSKFHEENDICATLGGYPHHVPRSIEANDPFLLGDYETFYVDMLQGMNHRWPGLSDYKTLVKDEIVMVKSNDTQSVAFRFSSTTLSHIEVVDLEITEPRGAVHVACQFPLVSINSSCLNGHFTCHDGTCILEHYFCDGVSDCPDTSDEVDCEHVCTFLFEDSRIQTCFESCFPANCTCDDLYFHCPLGGCLPWSRVCDGVGDCPRNEDEQICKFYYLDNTELTTIVEKIAMLHFKGMETLPEENFQCRDGRKISAMLQNDLVPDCWDQSDEVKYYNFVLNRSKTTYSTQNSLCSGAHETTCVKNYPGVCYPRHLFCIFESGGPTLPACRNAAHLSNCRRHVCPSQFKCPNAYCVSVHKVCDGQPDCPNGEDEVDCHTISCPGFLLCRHDKICVHRYDIWEGHVKCSESQDDKALGDVLECPRRCSCYGYAIRCGNGKIGSFPKLLVSLRALLLTNITIDLDDIKFKEGTFIFLLQLQITNAGLERLEPSHISGLTFLLHLNISFNAITSLKSRTFSALPNLLSIDFSYNLLHKLESDTFHGVHMVNTINLDHNNLQIISRCTFQHLRQLRVLKISHNKIAYLGENLLCGSNLKDLDISNNPLSGVDEASLLGSYHYLKRLNTAPIAICCRGHVPNDFHCLPTLKLLSISSCQKLIESSVIRKMLWLAGSALLPVLIGAITWCLWQIRAAASGRGLYNILSFLMFSSNLYICVYLLALSSVDHVSQGHYWSFEGKWRNSVVCILLGSLSYSFFLGSMLLGLLISCTRAIAILRPFRAQYISKGGIFGSAMSYFIACMTLGYVGVTSGFSGYVNQPEFALGLGFLLPSLTLQHKSLLWGLSFIIPNTLVLFSLCCSQLMLAKGLMVVPETIANVSGIVASRNRAKRLSIANLFLILIQYCPLLLMHFLAMFQTRIQTTALFLVIVVTMFFIPTTNVVLLVCLSGNFRRFILSIFKNSPAS